MTLVLEVGKNMTMDGLVTYNLIFLPQFFSSFGQGGQGFDVLPPNPKQNEEPQNTNIFPFAYQDFHFQGVYNHHNLKFNSL
jgi:hypothetical protein